MKGIFVILIFSLSVLPVKSIASQLEIVAGGFNSCKLFITKKKNNRSWIKYNPTPIKTRMYQSFFSTKDTHRKHFFISCFTGLIGAESLYFINSDYPNFVQTSKVDDYAGIINRFIKNKTNNPIDQIKVIGHSHGGWLAMTLVPLLSNITPIKTLITIDPISFNNCTKINIIENQFRRFKALLAWPFVYTSLVNKCVRKIRPLQKQTRREAKKECRSTLKQRGIEKSLKKYFSLLYNDPTDSCLSAPWEIDDTALTNQVDHWKNYYQNKSFFLHSSIYDQADENIFKDKSHLVIDTDEEIWEQFVTL